MTALRESEAALAIGAANTDRTIQSAEAGDLPCREDIFQLPQPLPLHFGGEIAAARIAWRLTGQASQPVILILGGISAGRAVFPIATDTSGWWKNIVGPKHALDTRQFRILGIDFIGGGGASSGPKAGEQHFPSISAYDQSAAIVALLKGLGINKLFAIVGASYGGMVALAFAERYPTLVDRIVVISAADRPHPLSTAWRSVQRATVKAMIEHGAGATGLKLARALAMATYRGADEFAQRFADLPRKTAEGYRFPVEDYLYARGQAYADNYVPEAFVCLSESIDLHRVDASKINTPATLVAVREDQLVPLADMQALQKRLAGPSRLVEISSVYGHDAFLKEASALRDVFANALSMSS